MSTRQIVKVGLDGGKKIAVKNPVGADVSIIMDGQTVGTMYLTENVTRVKPGVTLKPCHSHRNIEEIVYVIEGEGEVWIDGRTCKIKEEDSVLFPPNTVHTVRNMGTTTLSLLCFFSTPEYRKKGAYITYENIVFEDG